MNPWTELKNVIIRVIESNGVIRYLCVNHFKEYAYSNKEITAMVQHAEPNQVCEKCDKA